MVQPRDARTGRHRIRIKLVADVHGAADSLRREAADADALLVCGDLLNLVDYRTLEGSMRAAFEVETIRRFVTLRTAGRYDEAGATLRAAASGREEEVADRLRAANRAQYEAVFAALPDNTYLTHGNVDRPELFADLLRPGVRHLDGEAVRLDGLSVGFVGGGLPRGTDAERAARAERHFAAKVAALPPVDILCSHMPPAVDDLRFDMVAGHLEPGSSALLDYILEHQPAYAYFGHVHQPRAATLRLGRTWLVNLGYFRATGRMRVHPAVG